MKILHVASTMEVDIVLWKLFTHNSLQNIFKALWKNSTMRLLLSGLASLLKLRCKNKENPVDALHLVASGKWFNTSRRLEDFSQFDSSIKMKWKPMIKHVSTSKSRGGCGYYYFRTEIFDFLNRRLSRFNKATSEIP